MRDDERRAGRDEFDSRIDAALRSYAEPRETTEPRVALAQVMERVRAEQPERRSRWWIWGLTGAAACLLALVAALWTVHTPQVPQIAQAPAAPGVAAAPAHPSDTAAGRSFAPHVRRTIHAGHAGRSFALAASSKPLPKLAVFPTPRPLSPEEMALVAFAKHGPPEVRRAVLEDQKHWDDPLIVADLQKRPTQSGSQQDR